MLVDVDPDLFEYLLVEDNPVLLFALRRERLPVVVEVDHCVAAGAAVRQGASERTRRGGFEGGARTESGNWFWMVHASCRRFGGLWLEMGGNSRVGRKCLTTWRRRRRGRFGWTSQGNGNRSKRICIGCT